jgi:hypothetical protein
MTKAWQLLDAPEKWTQGAMARSNEGHPVAAKSVNACRWCLLGAMIVVWKRRAPANADYGLHSAIADRGYKGVEDFNDAPGRTWQEVYALLKDLDI